MIDWVARAGVREENIREVEGKMEGLKRWGEEGWWKDGSRSKRTANGRRDGRQGDGDRKSVGNADMAWRDGGSGTGHGGVVVARCMRFLYSKYIDRSDYIYAL